LPKRTSSEVEVMTVLAINAKLAIGNTVAVGAAQFNLAAANLAANVTLRGRTAKGFYFTQTVLDQQADDPLSVLAYLLASHAASSCQHKFQIGDVIEKVCRDAYRLSDELWGMRRCPLNRPSDDQISELQQQIATARAANGLEALPGFPRGAGVSLTGSIGVSSLPLGLGDGRIVPPAFGKPILSAPGGLFGAF
jgi:hypothetical protein